MIDLPAQKLVVLPAAALAQLRAAITHDGGDPGPVQEAGYAAGEALYGAFTERLADRGLRAPEALDLDVAQAEASAFFRETGWGEIDFEALGAAIAVNSSSWVEATADAAIGQPGCLFGTGMLAGFFGRLADAPLAALEVECRSMGGMRCRFLLGAAEVLEDAYEEMARGGSYAAAVSE